MARYALCALLGLLPVLFAPTALQNARANGDTRSLNMYHNHTRERVNVVYKRDGRYDRDALEKINWFLRDWRKNKSIEMDPQLLDLVWEVYRDLGATSAIHIICGYRDEVTNEMLRGRSISTGVAQHSQHTHGRAMDISIPGVPTQRLREMGFLKQRGGVGYYAKSGFVHLDIANVRAWPRMSTQQLAQLFPNGETLHRPSDGPPLAGYQTALARFGPDGKRGRSDNINVAAYAQQGLMSRNAPMPEPVKPQQAVAQREAAPVVPVAQPASLAERLNPLLAALPEAKDMSRLAPAPAVIASIVPPRPAARPSDLIAPELAAPQNVALLETGVAAQKPLNLLPQTATLTGKANAKTRMAALTAPRYDLRRASPLFVATAGVPAQNLTAPKLKLAAQFLDAPVTMPQGFALRGPMKQASMRVQKMAQL